MMKQHFSRLKNWIGGFVTGIGQKISSILRYFKEGGKMNEPRTAPSSLTDSAVRKYARRRGFKVHKFRGKDWYALIDSDGSWTVANDHESDKEDMYFSKYTLVEYLKGFPIVKEGDNE